MEQLNYLLLTKARESYCRTWREDTDKVCSLDIHHEMMIFRPHAQLLRIRACIHCVGISFELELWPSATLECTFATDDFCLPGAKPRNWNKMQRPARCMGSNAWCESKCATRDATKETTIGWSLICLHWFYWLGRSPWRPLHSYPQPFDENLRIFLQGQNGFDHTPKMDPDQYQFCDVYGSCPRLGGVVIR